jgi:hypothetical protein
MIDHKNKTRGETKLDIFRIPQEYIETFFVTNHLLSILSDITMFHLEPWPRSIEENNSMNEL